MLPKIGGYKTHQSIIPSQINNTEKKWTQNSSSVELFGKTVPLFKSGTICSLIIMFEKKNGVSDQNGAICQNGFIMEPFSKKIKRLKTVPPFKKSEAILAPLWSCFSTKKGQKWSHFGKRYLLMGA